MNSEYTFLPSFASLGRPKCTLNGCPCCAKGCGQCRACSLGYVCQCPNRRNCCGLPKQRCVCPYCPLTIPQQCAYLKKRQ